MASDLRKHSRQTQIRLVIGFLLLVFTLGEGLIWIFYGRGAMLVGLLCLGAAMIPVIAVGLALWGIEAVVKRADRD